MGPDRRAVMEVKMHQGVCGKLSGLDLDHDGGISLQLSIKIRTWSPNRVKRWGPHPERCPGLSDKQADKELWRSL